MIWQFVQQVTKLPDVFFVTKYKKTEDKGLNYFATLLSGLKAGERVSIKESTRLNGKNGFNSIQSANIDSQRDNYLRFVIISRTLRFQISIHSPPLLLSFAHSVRFISRYVAL